jgi:hypothetical protein
MYEKKKKVSLMKRIEEKALHLLSLLLKRKKQVTRRMEAQATVVMTATLAANPLLAKKAHRRLMSRTVFYRKFRPSQSFMYICVFMGFVTFA